MNRQQALTHMKPPGAVKPGKWMNGVIQIWVTRTCDRACFGCTQGSNLKSSTKENMFITLENFEIAVSSLVGYHGVIGIFGGNPALHPKFPELCEILRKYIPFEHRGLWCNNPFGHAAIMRETFNPAVSNLNVHMDLEAYDRFKTDWPECRPVGLVHDSRHPPVHGSMLDLKDLPDPADPLDRTVPNTEENRWYWISRCDINQHWSGMVGQFRGQPRAWFCEVAGAQAMLMQDQDIPDTGIPLPSRESWWRGDMDKYADQVDYHCHRCLVPLRGYGELACSTTGVEVTTKTYLPVFQPKKTTRGVHCVNSASQLNSGKLKNTVDYIGNSKK